MAESRINTLASYAERRTVSAALQASVQPRVRGPEAALEAGWRRGGHQARRHRGAGHRQRLGDVEALQCEQVEDQQSFCVLILRRPVPCARCKCEHCVAWY